MAKEQSQIRLSFPAGADLSSSQYRFVELASDGTVTVCNAAGEKAIGVLQNNPLQGNAASVCIFGRTSLVAGATLATGGVDITTDSTGRAIAASTTGHARMGVLLETAGAANEVVSCLIRAGAPLVP